MNFKKIFPWPKIDYWSLKKTWFWHWVYHANIYGITRFQVIMTLKKTTIQDFKSFNSSEIKVYKKGKERIRRNGSPRDLKNQEVCNRFDKTLGTWRHKECEENLCEKCFEVFYRQMFVCNRGDTILCSRRAPANPPCLGLIYYARKMRALNGQ